MHLKITPAAAPPFEESTIVTSLLTRQDEVLAELDGLERQILSVISEIAAERAPSETEVDDQADDRSAEVASKAA